MDDIEDKRVFGSRAGKTRLVVAAGIGLVAVDVAEDRLGGFGVVHRCSPADTAGAAGTVAAATNRDVFVGDGDTFEPAGFGPAVAVGFHDELIVAADPDGRVATTRVAATDDWTDVGRLDAAVNALDGELIAADDGVHRLASGVPHAGLTAVRDVSATGMPLAATDGGLYGLGNGWMDVLDGAFRVAASDGALAHAATRNSLYERVEGAWSTVDGVQGSVVDIDYGDRPYAVTAEGTLLTPSTDGTGWRFHALGLDAIVGLAVV